MFQHKSTNTSAHNLAWLLANRCWCISVRSNGFCHQHSRSHCSKHGTKTAQQTMQGIGCCAANAETGNIKFHLLDPLVFNCMVWKSESFGNGDLMEEGIKCFLEPQVCNRLWLLLASPWQGPAPIHPTQPPHTRGKPSVHTTMHGMNTWFASSAPCMASSGYIEAQCAGCWL